MHWIESVNFLKRGIPVQNEQEDVKLDASHIESFKNSYTYTQLWEGQTYSLTPLKLFLWMGQQPNFRMASL